MVFIENSQEDRHVACNGPPAVARLLLGTGLINKI